MSTINQNSNLTRVKIRGINPIALAANDSLTVWIPGVGQSFVVSAAYLQLKSRTGTVATAPIFQLIVNDAVDVNLTAAVTAPAINASFAVGDVVIMPLLATSIALQITNSQPLTIKMTTDQGGATVLTYDLILFGLPLHNL